ncbi:TonB-dependent receptor [Dysgonomonas sp. 25]|uniref:SusC/RagA family TonB-linked outer membrane protein n=1 Tax=Dysgonomonas sp. 25 TaxID=2302933 RepID=UPI0013D60588|nr:TonB-dependent receptor [Dysgonomonas sp. 25]NDV69317.1 TonB-dependent receptor [Dysgonomonas sp. 25]
MKINLLRKTLEQRTISLKKFLLVACLLVVSVAGYAQSQTITGTVVDEFNEPLIGVSVVVRGTTNGVSTDIDGAYSISASSSDVLEFSYVGMKAQSVTVGSQTVINIKMEENATMLTETVVIGYGTSKKQDLTGSIGSVNSEAIMRQPALNAAQSVQGKIAGVNIIGSDAPGSSPTVVIRGLGTALGGRNPLYIVDGFPVDDIKNISPSDIVSMDVLKDASSASIYGLRAANGVIIVTTKKGKEGHNKISVDSYVGIKSVLNRVKMANAEQYVTYYNENLTAQGSATGFLAPASQQPADTDWYDELLETGLFNSNTVSISGGSRAVDYFVSYNYYDEKGILDEQKYKRSTIRNNNVYRLFNDRLKISQNLNISFTNETPKPYGAFNEAYRQSPILPTHYSTGRYASPFYDQGTGTVWTGGPYSGASGELNSYGNPLFTIANSNERAKTLTLQGGFEGELKITDFLKATSRFGATKYYYKNRVFSDIRRAYLNTGDAVSKTEAQFDALKAASPSATSYANNSLALEDIETFRWVWEGFLSFNKEFDLHHIDAVAGMSAERYNIGSRSYMKGYDVPAKSQYWNLSEASSLYEKTIEHVNYTPTALASFFGRVQYNYAGKYYATATIRRDGSSKFKENNRNWGNFPSFGLGWTISEEEFMKENGVFDYLKLRATWGKLGNQNVPLNVSQILSKPTNSNYNYVFGDPAGYYMGAAFGTPVKDISWEITRETSIGFDFAMLNQRLTGGFDFYDKMNTNTILRVNPVLNSGFDQAFYDHGAKVSNRGFEFNLGWTDKILDGLRYEVSMNYSYNKNKVKNVKPAYDGDTGGSLSNGHLSKRLMINRPIYGWWLYEADGVWQTQAEISSNPHVGTPLPGHLKYKDQNEDGIIDERDKVYAGSYLPISTYGIHIGAEYKNFDFSIDGYGVAGNKVFNALKYGRIDGGENISKDTFKDRWTGAGSTNKHPGANRDKEASTYYLESGSYFRINNITLGYTFNDLVFKGSKLRLYATAQNPFMFTDYSGFTPEITGDGSPNGTAGMEMSAYPTTRNFLFGVNLQF